MIQRVADVNRTAVIKDSIAQIGCRKIIAKICIRRYFF
jgi:hypothetical protein